MRVGVTGGTGFIGQYLIRDYGDKYDFIIPVRNKNTVQKNYEYGTYVESDFSVDSLKKIFDGCDAVIHMAAKVMPKKKEVLCMADYMENILCTANVLEACKELGIAKVVCTSTKSVLGTANASEKKILTEADEPAPDDEYGVSKACVETLADFYHKKYGMNIILYRMSEVCGMDLTRGMLNPFWAAVLNAVTEKRAVPIYGKGIGGRDLIYVKDVTRALVMALEKNNTGIFHIGSGVITTNIEIARAFCDVFGSDAGVELHPDKPEWGTSECLGVEKAKHILGFETGYHIRDIVEDIKQEYIKFRCMEEMNKIG